MLKKLSARAMAISGISGLALLALVSLNSFHTVESGYEGVLLDWGAVQNTTLEPGKLHLIIPFYQRLSLVSTQPQTSVTHEKAATHDLQDVDTSVAVTYHIDPVDVPFFYATFRNTQRLTDRVIAPSISNDVKAITAHYNAEELVTKRDEVDEKIKDLIITSLKPYRITIEAINTANFQFSPAYSHAIEDKQVQQQAAQKANYLLQQTKINEQQKVVRASAEAEATVAQAKGQSTSKLMLAEAEAKANALVSASLSPALLEEKALLQWDGTMPTYLSAGAPLPFIGNVASSTSR